MKEAVLIRQRPALGDAALLSSVVRALREDKGFDRIVVVTDETYLDGALVETFLAVPGVDVVRSVRMAERTTPENRHYDGSLSGAAIDLVEWLGDFHDGDTAIYDLNTAFLKHEWDYASAPPKDKPARYGIADFWLRHLGLWHDGIDALPRLQTTEENRAAVKSWLKDDDRPLLGIVLRAGDARRNWDSQGFPRTKAIVDWAHSAGYRAVTIDPNMGIASPYAMTCAGRPLGFVFALIEECKAIVTPDTGLMHAAQALGTPSVSLWGVVDPAFRTQGYRTIRLPRGRVPVSDRPDDYADARRVPLGEIVEATRTLMRLEP